MRLSESEWQIMNALWRRHPATARELTEQLPEKVSWAYTTIKTMLTRLVAKGAVAESKRGNTSVYEPLVTQKAARRSALGRLLDSAFGGGVEPLVHLLAEERGLTDSARRELLEILKREHEAADEEET